MPRTTSPPGSPPSPRGQRTALVLLSALVLVGLAALGAAADRDGAVTYAEGWTWELEGEPPEIATPEEAPPTGIEELPLPPQTTDSDAVWIVPLVLLGIVAAALLVWLAMRIRHLMVPRIEQADDVPEVEELTLTQARSALDDAHQRLSTAVSAHDAVIEAWLALERSIAAAGIRRGASQTTLEYVSGVLGALDLDGEALAALAALYRRALFDPEPLAEADRDSALASMARLSDQLAEDAR